MAVSKVLGSHLAVPPSLSSLLLTSRATPATAAPLATFFGLAFFLFFPAFAHAFSPMCWIERHSLHIHSYLSQNLGSDLVWE